MDKEKTLALTILSDPDAAALPQPAESGRLPALVSGLSAVHRAHLAAALRSKYQRPTVILCPDDAAASALAGDFTALTGEDCEILPGRDYVLYSADAVSRSGEQRRLTVLEALSGRAPAVIITAEGLFQRAMPPEVFRRAVFTLDVKEPCAPEDLVDALLRCGYSSSAQVEGPGQFSRRGGIVDFFSPAYPQPVRVEFWGDEIDSMGFFDTVSQRRTESAGRCRIVPAAEVLPTLAKGGAKAVAASLEALADNVSKRRAGETGAILSGILREDAERLASGAELPAADRYAALIYGGTYTALDYIPRDAIVILDQPGRFAEAARNYIKRVTELVTGLVSAGKLSAVPEDYFTPFDAAMRRLRAMALYMADSFTAGRYAVSPKSIVTVRAKQLPSYAGSASQAAEDLASYRRAGYSVVVLAGDMRRARLLSEYLGERGVQCSVTERLSEIPPAGGCVITSGGLSAGLEYPSIRLAVLTDTQIVASGYKKRRQAARKKSAAERIGSCADLAVGDLVVHEHHGIGRFAGVVRMKVDGAERDYMKISFAGSDTLYVPATQLDLVSKYIGAGEDRPVKLSKMGGTEWQRTKSRAKAAAKELAGELIKLYSERTHQKGHAFAPDSPWQREFEERFPYEETGDQLRCVEEIKSDMEKPVPMDRLLCGDVGYGKTEVALRAVMKCILDGKQAAILVPTTVLAQQHYQTAVERFAGYPINIAVLSRFRTNTQMKKSIAELAEGSCDLVIGTHRLLQKDVKFKDLGLLVVDEEQRFGVTHKEHIKELSRQVDVLTLSATPIPRTLNMALSGIRDMSTIEEPPMERLPVQTFVMEHDWGVLCDAMRRELDRGGQVYYLHNRVDTIDRTALKISELMDGAAVAVAHGKMSSEQLGRIMEDMGEGRIQILVCTTIIETGIDIPNVNTLIIEDADQLGLAQLHQIRGRVGRSARRASAYFTFKRSKVLSEIAEKRLEAIREFAEFNSGFRIAMRDLEIRGAGSLLGAEQSGHLTDVGYDMYLRLLEEAVNEERGIKTPKRAATTADIIVSAGIPGSYVPSSEQRMDLYRRIALIRTESDADDVLDELIDRYGEPPKDVTTLVRVALLRGEAGDAGITDITQKGDTVRFTLDGFDMERVSELYAQSAWKGRLKVEAAAKPVIAMRLKNRARVLDEASAFVAGWKGTEKDSDKKGDN